MSPVAEWLESIGPLQRSARDQCGEAAGPDARTWGFWGLGRQRLPVAQQCGLNVAEQAGEGGLIAP